MSQREPLNAPEEQLWRALAEVIITLPRALDEEFVREAGVTMTEYGLLVALSEAPDRELRLSDLAAVVSLSLSRISRLVDSMAKRGLVSRRKCSEDKRGSLAVLTDQGLAALKAAYPGHLNRVRTYVFDQLDADKVKAMGPIITQIARALREGGV